MWISERSILVRTLTAALAGGTLLAVSGCSTLRSDAKALMDFGDRHGESTVFRGLGESDGYLPSGTSLSPFDAVHPALTNLDPALRAALRSAAADAQEDGIRMVVTSGWRSAPYQKSLLDNAVRTYASEDEARRWVNTPERSTHVSGDAVDIGPTDADSWLAQHGERYGLCQTYANEMWHFELATVPGGSCPAQIDDASVG
ncbi:M15 family metallopeptidase [Prescottella sp. R16]|uniref:M15 family metallopeptidase n=1 Tax=Prescottella sp. R16 TaxID=3064529 RepID=UPI00272DCA99|nr:M15 family metallopeptidase [Prescottella sp. R16]